MHIELATGHATREITSTGKSLVVFGGTGKGYLQSCDFTLHQGFPKRLQNQQTTRWQQAGIS